MKTIIALIGLFVAVNTASAALSYADVLGVWKGTRTEVFQGRIAHGTQTTRFQKLGAGGFSGVATIVFPGIGRFQGVGKYIAGGRYQAAAFYNGVAISTSTGTWKIVGNVIKVRFSAQALNGASRGTAQLNFVNSRTLVAISSQSNSGRVSVTLRRR